MGRWQGVFLDFYGTVASGDVLAVESACQQVIDDHGLDLAASDLAVQWGHCYFAAIEAVDGQGFRLLRQIEHDTLVETVLPLVGRIDARPYVEQLNAYLLRPTLFEEVPGILERLALPVCIVSNADDRELQGALKHHRLQFNYVVSSESARSYKPDRRIFETALELTGWSPDHVVHVGDSLHSDVEGAHRAGIRAAWVCRAQRIGDIGTARPDFTWSDLRPLLRLQAD